MSRTEWLVGIFVGLLISGIVLVVLFFVSKRTDEIQLVEQVAVAPTSVFSGLTSMQAYDLAKEKALEWQPDAVLLTVDTTWPQGTSQEQLLSGVAMWNLGFYSPGSTSVANFSVLDGQANLVNQHKLERTLSPRQLDDWRIDSSVAAYRLLDEGGQDFLSENEVSTLIMSLTTDNQSNRLEWLLSFFGVQANNTLTMRLDASTGEILETVHSN